jgi:hypothetical protein
MDSTLYFVHRTGGIVYQLKEDSLQRIDRSFDYKMQINSTVFARNDTLMRYGGYGFWSDRNFFTYYSKASNEWEIIAPSGSDQLPRGGQMTVVAQTGNKIYIFSGVSTNKFNPLVFEDQGEVWSFDITLRRWDHLGNQDRAFHQYTELLHLGDRILYGVPDRTQWVLADPARNQLSYYEVNADRRGLYPRLPQPANEIRSFYDHGKMYLVRRKKPNQSGAQDGELFYTIMDEETFLGEPAYTEEMYASKGFPIKLAGGAVGVIGILLLVFFGRKRYLEKGKLLVSEKNIRYGGKKVFMDATSLKVLNLLLRAREEVHSREILDIVENSLQSPSHNIRVKNQVIENLNIQLKTLLGLDEDVIHSLPSREDKRIKSYQINSQFFKVR